MIGSPPQSALFARHARERSRRSRLGGVALVIAVLAVGAGRAGAAPDPLADLGAARAMQARGQWAAAESLAAGALRALEADARPDSLAIADACLLRGIAHMRRSGYADGAALADGGRALGIRRRAHVAAPALADAELLVGRALQGAGRGDSALVHLQRAADLRAAALAVDDTLVAEGWDQLALLRRDRREYRAAIETWGRAIAVRSRHDGGDSPAVAQMQAQTGACWMELDDRATARQVLEGSLATFARLGQLDHPARWVPLNILSDLEAREGNIAHNIDMLQEALRLVNRSFGPDSRQALTLRLNLGGRLIDIADYAGAEGMFEAAFPLARAQYGPAHWRTSQVLLGLGLTRCALGELPAGLRAFSQAESILAVASGPGSASLSWTLNQHALSLAEHGRPAEALELCARADRARAAERPSDGSLALTTQIVRVVALLALDARDSLAAARRTLDSLADRYSPRGARFDGQVVYQDARIDAALGRRDTAWAEALEAERIARASDGLNLRLLSDRRGLEYAHRNQRCLDLVMNLARGDPTRTPTAWDRLVRTRGLLRSELARRTVPLAFADDSELVANHARWRSAQERVARLTVRGSGRDSTARAELARAQAEADEGERRFASALSARGAGTVPGDQGLADVRARLSPGQALLAFDVTSTSHDTARVCALLTRDDGAPAKRIELGPAIALSALIDPWRAALAAPPGIDARAADRLERAARVLGARVRAKVWDPLANDLRGVRELYVVGDGPLEDLPWAALPEGASYLVERGPLIHPLDAERALLLDGPAGPKGRLLAVGAPDFDRAGDAQAPTPALAALVRAAPDPCADIDALHLPPLPGSGAEAEAVASAWRAAGAGPATLLEGTAAAEAAFKHDAPGCAVIHLATHGVMRGNRCAEGAPGERGMGGVTAVVAATGSAPRPAAQAAAAKLAPSPPAPASPWLTRRVLLALAGANRASEHRDDDDEGLLTSEEVSMLDLDGTDWVVLSACHSGVGDPWSADGRLGMRRAFALAGARSVIASAWALDDAATGEWMTALYAARLHGDTDAAAAIRAASRDVLAARRASHRSTHPFYWAAFSTGAR